MTLDADRRSEPAADRVDRAELVDGVLIPAGLFVLAVAVYAWLNNGREAQLDYFVPLADAFLHGRLGLTEMPSNLNELVPFNGLAFVVYPPMPAIILLPAVLLFGPGFDQAWASILLGAVNVVVMHALLRGMGTARRPALVLALVFAFGTIVWYSAQAGSSWHFAHVVATFFMLLAIRACQLDARAGLIGLLFGAAVISRLPLMLAAPFFMAYIADAAHRETTGDRTVFGSLLVARPPARDARPSLRRFIDLGTPLAAGAALPVVGYLIYNYMRFGSPLQTGYALIPGLLQETQYRDGFFSIVNIPRKLYALFLSAPAQVNGFPWIQSRHLGGLSILLTTPLFLWSIRARRPDWFNLGAWVSVALILIPILLHADAWWRAVRIPIRAGPVPVPVPADGSGPRRSHLARGLDRDRDRRPHQPVGDGLDLLRLVGVIAPGRSDEQEPTLRPLLLLLAGGLLVRLLVAVVILPDGGHQSDLALLAQWARELATNGPGAFYRPDSGYFADYPPVYLYILWLTGIAGRAWSTTFGGGDVTPLMIKLPFILADLGLAAVLFLLTRRLFGQRAGLVAAAVFLFNPAAILVSTVWGQNDSIATLAVVGAIYLLVTGRTEAAAAVGVIAMLIKFQYGFVIPIIAIVGLRRHLLGLPDGDGTTWPRDPRRIGLALLASAATLILLCLPFGLRLFDPSDPAHSLVARFIAASKAFPGVTQNAFNLWMNPFFDVVIHGASGATEGHVVDDAAVAFAIGGFALTWQWIGNLLFVAAVLVALSVLVRRSDGAAIVFVALVIAVAFFALPTRVHERYLYPALALGLPLLAAGPGVATPVRRPVGDRLPRRLLGLLPAGCQRGARSRDPRRDDLQPCRHLRAVGGDGCRDGRAGDPRAPAGQPAMGHGGGRHGCGSRWVVPGSTSPPPTPLGRPGRSGHSPRARNAWPWPSARGGRRRCAERSRPSSWCPSWPPSWSPGSTVLAAHGSGTSTSPRSISPSPASSTTPSAMGGCRSGTMTWALGTRSTLKDRSARSTRPTGCSSSSRHLSRSISRGCST